MRIIKRYDVGNISVVQYEIVNLLGMLDTQTIIKITDSNGTKEYPQSNLIRLREISQTEPYTNDLRPYSNKECLEILRNFVWKQDGSGTDRYIDVLSAIYKELGKDKVYVKKKL